MRKIFFDSGLGDFQKRISHQSNISFQFVSCELKWDIYFHTKLLSKFGECLFFCHEKHEKYEKTAFGMLMF